MAGSLESKALPLIALLVGIIAIIATFVVPEIRQLVGLDPKPTSTLTLPPLATSTQRIDPTQTPQQAISDTPTSPIAAVTPSLEPTNTKVPTPAENLLYQADWSEGMNGWVGSPDWTTVSGMLVNDASAEFPASGIVFPPFKPGNTMDYVVEAEIQAVGGPNGSCAGHYGFIVRGQEKEAKLSGILIASVNTFCSGQGYLTISPWSSPTPPYNIYGESVIAPIDDGNWHTYRIEAKANTIRLLIDGIPSLEVTDNQYLEGGIVSLWSGGTTLNVRSFKILEN